MFFSIYHQVQLFIICFTTAQTHLLYRADGDTGSTGHDEVAVLDVRSDLIQHKGNDVWLHSQEQNIAFADRLFVACGEVDTQPLHIKREKQSVKLREQEHCLNLEKRQIIPPIPPLMGLGARTVHTRSPCTVGRSLSGALAVILWVAITP